MATTTVLSNPYVSLDANDFTDQCTSATVTSTIEALEDTAFGSTARTYTAGLESNEITVTLLLSYGASEVEAILDGLVGTKFNTVVGASSVTPSASNPVYTLTNGYLESFTPINGNVGELQTVDISIRGGALTRAVS